MTQPTLVPRAFKDLASTLTTELSEILSDCDNFPLLKKIRPESAQSLRCSQP